MGCPIFDILLILGEFSAEFNKKSSLKICEIFYNLGELAIWFKLSEERVKILNYLKKVKCTCSKYFCKGERGKLSREIKEREKIVEVIIERLKNYKKF